MRGGARVALASLLIVRAAGGQVPTPATPPPPQVPTNPVLATRGLRDRAELEAFIDGIVTMQLREKHVAGAVVSVVKDGKLFFAKGYGYSDLQKRTPVIAESTLFRVGSISKLITYTAVMQLAERGKLDLNRDLNAYLDFKIPATFSAPITLTHAMTQTPGLEEDPRDLFTNDSAHVSSMKQWLPAHMPQRVRPPGTLSAYSNWATAIAGYVVERTAGMSFDDYVEREIFTPLAMTRTTFRQPLPNALRPTMSVGYRYVDGRFEARPYEMATGAAPAGAMSSTATDMANFMIAHLANGAFGDGRILADSTAELMRRRAFAHDPRINGYAHGFYEQSSHGLRVVGHGGDTQWFHSNLALIPSDGVGLFVSYNTDTGTPLTEAFTDVFLDHYYPTPEPWISSRATPEQLQRFAGEYLNDRMSFSTFMKVASLVSANSFAVADSGALVTSYGGNPIRFVPIDSLLFRAENGDLLLAFRADAKGKITHAFFSDDPTSALVKTTGLQSPRLHFLVLGVALFVFLLTVISAIVRRVYAASVSALPDRSILVAMSLAFLLAIVLAPAAPINIDTILHNQFTGFMWLLALPVIGGLLALVALVLAVRQWRSGAGSRWSRIRFTSTVALALAFVWSLNSWNLLGWRL